MFAVASAREHSDAVIFDIERHRNATFSILLSLIPAGMLVLPTLREARFDAPNGCRI